MQQQGAADVQQSTTYKMLLADLFNKIKGINDQVCLKEYLGDKVWSEADNFPAREEFEESFKLEKKTKQGKQR
eukprot:6527172-Ditylum_brightwellii.AAC.2